MKTRSIKKLLVILRDNLKSSLKGIYCGGICCTIDNLKRDNIISLAESHLLLDYLENHKPKNAIARSKKRFVPSNYDNEGFLLSLHWWKPRALAPRIKWLNEQINKL